MHLAKWVKKNMLVLLAGMTAAVVITIMLSTALVTGHIRRVFDENSCFELDLLTAYTTETFHQMRTDLRAFASAVAFASGQDELQSLISLHIDRSQYTHLAVVDFDSQWVVANCPAWENMLLNDLTAGKLAHLPYIGNLFYLPEPGVDVVAYHHYFSLNDADFLAVGLVPLAVIQRAFATFCSPEMGIAVFDYNGQLLFGHTHCPERMAWVDDNLYTLLDKHRDDGDGEEVIFSATDGQGVAHFFYFKQLPYYGWQVGIIKPRSLFLRQLVLPVASPLVSVALICVLFGLYVWQSSKSSKLEYMLDSVEQLQEMESLTIMGKMAAGIAHEVKNPLSVIDGYIQLMELYPKKYGNKKTLSIIRQELERIVPILNEYLALGRKSAAAVGEVDLNKLLQSILRLMEVYAYRNAIQFKTWLDPRLPLLEGDSDKLRQVFVNLIKNAIEAIDGGGTVSVETQFRDNNIIVTVEDTGRGIPAEHLPWVDVPFFTTKDGGTGLGLPVSYRNVAEHGGTIKVDSTPGVGTKFTITLPGRR